MALTFRKLHPTFVAEARGVQLSTLTDPKALAEIRAGMDEYGVLVFPEQPLTDDEHLAFAQALDGALHQRTGARVLTKSRFDNEALGDISNLGNDGEILQQGDRRRAYSLGNRLWHTDASFQDPPGRYSMLSAKVVPPAGADTEYADLRAAYDALPAGTKAQIADLKAHHSIAYSRQVLGFEFSAQEEDALRGAIHPVVRTLPRTNRKSLYVASHASRIIDWPLPEGRLLLRDLIEHATQRQFVYRHAWHVGDLVIWDNRCTMHRATPFEDTKFRRELRRVTTLDIPDAVPVAAAV
jgi:alpha-ketoglutarate-dependent 2,4-dichlorophenoxyacetate dioxygenase